MNTEESYRIAINKAGSLQALENVQKHMTLNGKDILCIADVKELLRGTRCEVDGTSPHIWGQKYIYSPKGEPLVPSQTYDGGREGFFREDVETALALARL